MGMYHLIYYVICSLLVIDLSLSTTYYVDPDRASSGTGRAWNRAFVTLEEALSASVKLTDDIWIKGGHTLIPSTTNRSNCFAANIGTAMYGGFIGTESSIDDRPASTDSIYDQYQTILSGDINVPKYGQK